MYTRTMTYNSLRYAFLWWTEYVTAAGKRLPTDGIHTVSYDDICWC